MHVTTHTAADRDGTPADGAKPENRPIWAVLKPNIWRRVASIYTELDSPTLPRRGRRRSNSGAQRSGTEVASHEPGQPTQPAQPADRSEPPRAIGISEDRSNPDQHAAHGAMTIALCVALIAALLVALIWLLLGTTPIDPLTAATIAFVITVVVFDPLHVIAPPLNRRLRRLSESIGANAARRRGIRKGLTDEAEPDTPISEQIALWQELLNRRTRPLSWIIAGAKSASAIRMAIAMLVLVPSVAIALTHAPSSPSMLFNWVVRAVLIIPQLWLASIALGIVLLIRDRRRLRRLLTESRCVRCDYPAGVEPAQLTDRVCSECGSDFPLPPPALIPDDQ